MADRLVTWWIFNPATGCHVPTAVYDYPIALREEDVAATASAMEDE